MAHLNDKNARFLKKMHEIYDKNGRFLTKMAQPIDEKHPFFDLECNNVMIIHTWNTSIPY